MVARRARPGERITTLSRCDRIVVLDKGTVAETGTHDELLKLGGKYAKLVEINQYQ